MAPKVMGMENGEGKEREEQGRERSGDKLHPRILTGSP